MGAHGNIFPNTEIAEQANILKGARDARYGEIFRTAVGKVSPSQGDSPACRLYHPRQEVEGRGLACAVRTDKAQDLSGLQREGIVGQRDEPAKALRQLFRL